jgi:hypothetical protein
MESAMLKPLGPLTPKTKFDPLYELKLTNVSRPWIQAPPDALPGTGPFLALLLEELSRLPIRSIEFRTEFGLVAGSFINVSDITREEDFEQNVEQPIAYPVLPTRLFQYEDEIKALATWTEDTGITILSTRFSRPLPRASTTCAFDTGLYDDLDEYTQLLQEDAFLSTLFKVPVAELGKPELQRELAYLQRGKPENLIALTEENLKSQIIGLYRDRRDNPPNFHKFVLADVEGDSDTQKANRESLRNQLTYYNSRADIGSKLSTSGRGSALLERVRRLYTEPFLLERSRNRAYLQKLLNEEAEELNRIAKSFLRPSDDSYLYLAVDTRGNIIGHALWYDLSREESVEVELLFSNGDVVTPDQYATRSVTLEFLCGSESVQAALILRGLIDTATMDATTLVEAIPRSIPWLVPVRRELSESFETEVLVIYYPLDFEQSNLLLAAGFEPLFSSNNRDFLPGELRNTSISAKGDWYDQRAKQFIIPDTTENISLDEAPPHLSPSSDELEFSSITALQYQLFVSPLLDRFDYGELIELLKPIKIALPFDVQSMLDSVHNRVTTLMT